MRLFVLAVRAHGPGEPPSGRARPSLESVFVLVILFFVGETPRRADRMLNVGSCTCARASRGHLYVPTTEEPKRNDKTVSARAASRRERVWARARASAGFITSSSCSPYSRDTICGTRAAAAAAAVMMYSSRAPVRILSARRRRRNGDDVIAATISVVGCARVKAATDDFCAPPCTRIVVSAVAAAAIRFRPIPPRTRYRVTSRRAAARYFFWCFFFVLFQKRKRSYWLVCVVRYANAFSVFRLRICFLKYSRPSVAVIHDGAEEGFLKILT